MRRILPILFSMLIACTLPLHGQETVTTPDEDEGIGYVSPFPGLDSLLTQFYAVLERETVEAKNREFDNLIGMVSDSLARQHVTMNIFDHYCYSRIMGEEAVAVHVYDKWIASGLVKTRGEFEDMQADIFVRFNRNSLLGMKAPQVELYKPSGAMRSVPAEGKISILFFYDTDCMKCRMESMVLPQTLAKIEFPADFNAVYVGSDKRSWKQYRKNFKVNNRKVKVNHYWDPEIDSNYAIMYAVNATPRMYVVLDDLEIIGRRLEVTNLEQIINYINMTYGQKEEKQEKVLRG